MIGQGRNNRQNGLFSNRGIFHVKPDFNLLLDRYSGATAAYSLRRLSKKYTGDCLVVRRDSDNATQSIGFVNNVVDTESIESFCIGASGFVTTWFDQSNLENHAKQTLASSQPMIYTINDGVTKLGNKPSVYFGSGEGLWLDNVVSFKTAFLLAKIDTINSLGNIIMQSGNIFFGYGGGYSGLNGVFYFSGYPFSLAGEDTNSHLVYFNSNEKLEIAIDRGTKNTFEVDPVFKMNQISNPLFSYSFLGPIQEIILYASEQSINRTYIETDINDFYSIY